MEVSQPNPHDLAPEAKPKELEVHTMPQKFLHPSGAKKSHPPLSPLRKAVIILGVIVALLVVGAYLLLAVFNQPDPKVVDNGNSQNEPLNIPLVNRVVNANENFNAAANINGLFNLNFNGNLNQNSNVNGNLNENTSQNENVNALANVNINTNVNAPATIAGTQDTDGDGLTDQEEALYETNDNLKDTDADGFVDGLEVMNGYSPLLSPGTTLLGAEAVSVYANVTHTFSVDYPKSWVVDARTANEILFITSTTEFIEILIEQKRANQSISDWYDEQVSVGGASELTLTDVNGLPTLIAKNGLTYYIGDEDKVFVLTYNYGTRDQINFRTSYYMMLDSFVRALREAPANPSGTNSNANRNTNSNLNINKNANTNVNSSKNSNQNLNQNKNTNTNANKNKNTSS